MNTMQPSVLTRIFIELLRLPVIFWWRYVQGWNVLNELPDLAKFVILGVPHTSNWDYWHMLAAAATFKRRPNVTVKHTMFKGPAGWFIRAAGGIPIDRTKSTNLVHSIAQSIKDADRMLLIFTPEGSRSKTFHWKTGFYYTALEAGVPIVLAYIDYRQRRLGIGPTLIPTGDIYADMEIIREFYTAHGYPLYLEKRSEIALPPEKVVS